MHNYCAKWSKDEPGISNVEYHVWKGIRYFLRHYIQSRLGESESFDMMQGVSTAWVWRLYFGLGARFGLALALLLTLAFDVVLGASIGHSFGKLVRI